MKYENAIVHQSVNRINFYVKVVSSDSGVQVGHYNEIRVEHTIQRLGH